MELNLNAEALIKQGIEQVMHTKPECFRKAHFGRLKFAPKLECIAEDGLVRSPLKDCFLGEILDKTISSLEIGKSLENGKLYELDIANHALEINLGGSECLRVDNPTLQTKLKTLKNGESITIGSAEGNADILIGSNRNGVSEEHLKIKKIAGKFTIENASPFETKVNETNISLNPGEAQNATDLYFKIQKQLDLTTAKDLEQAVDKVMQKVSGATRQEVITVMQKMTQWGNYKSLENMVSQLNDMGIGRFYARADLTFNPTLSYIGYKGAFKLKSDSTKWVYNIDSSSLKMLENLKKTDPEKFEKLVYNPKIQFINLSGWDGMNIYNANADISELSSELLSTAKQFQSSNPQLPLGEAIEKAMNKDTLDRADALGITPITIHNTSVENASVSISQVLKQIEPLNISNKTMNAIIDATAEGLYPNQPEQIKKAKQLLVGYFDNQMDIYSPKSMAKKLKNIHSLIIDEVKQSGKSLDNVYYIIPESNRSFELVSLQYAKVNGIDQSKIFYYNGLQPLPHNIPENATLVILDDNVASGGSIINEPFHYKDFLNTCKNQNILFAPMTCSKKGANYIEKNISTTQRLQTDKLIINPDQIKTPLDETDFYKNLGFDDKSMLNTILGGKGNDRKSAFSLVLPYMGTDGCSKISSLLNQFLVLNPKALKVSPNIIYEDILTRFVSLMKQYGEPPLNKEITEYLKYSCSGKPCDIKLEDVLLKSVKGINHENFYSQSVSNIDGKLFRGGMPLNEDAIRDLKKINIKTVICVLRKDAKYNNEIHNWVEEQELCKKYGINFKFIEMDERFPPTSEIVKEFLDTVKSSESTYLHCRAGQDRTGLLAAIYDVDVLGKTFDEAYARMIAQGHDFMNFRDLDKFLYNHCLENLDFAKELKSPNDILHPAEVLKRFVYLNEWAITWPKSDSDLYSFEKDIKGPLLLNSKN